MTNKNMNIILIILFVFCLILSPISSEKAKAGTMENNVVNGGTAAEKQFWSKVKAIKSVFGDKVDDVALAATILYAGNSSSVLKAEYDEDYNEDEYKSEINYVSSTGGIESSDTDNESSSEQQDSYGQTKGKADLLLAATIVMLDSSGFSTYSDEKYEEALAGNRLVGNMVEDDCDENDKCDLASLGLNVGANIYNAIFCGVGALFDTASTPLQFGLHIFNGEETENDFIETKAQRYVTMTNVCKYGYIGGTVSNVRNTTDKKVQKAQKKKIAKEIIKLANEYRKIYGTEGTGSGVCGTTQASELKDLSNEEYIEKMGPLAQADYSRTGIYASVTIAQSIQEAGWPYTWTSSSLAVTNNNQFGIKCAKRNKCKDGYSSYESIEAGVADHSTLFNEKTYPGYSTASSPKAFLEKVGPIYCPVSDGCGDYAGTVNSLIEQYDLTKWDVKTNTSSDDCPDPGEMASSGGWQIRSIKPSSSDSAFTKVFSNRGQCVWYAQGRAIEIVEELEKNNKLTSDEAKKIKKQLLKSLGNGGEIYDNAVSRNSFKTSNDVRKPKAGSFIVWKKKGDYGHVAVVEEVTDSKITITEGYSNSGSSCPNDWSCVTFNTTTKDLKSFYKNYGKKYTGGYTFSGYVYFLELK